MPLTPWKSLWETRFPSFREEMNKVFEDFFSTAGFPSLKEGGLIPAVDIHETKSDVIITMDMPAINPKDISISVIEDKLTVKG
jgi:HSP20 family protein